ncbi:hypothetical protein BD289DRAFT_428957 [Coniella lustricola]|uniref:Uncharacterized protein n=1 Tax=Coniella lustricola TaxID=2025994 RepID=A0A2T3ADE1_9PEZI|nr:hypothetical protein BD289DRAFT_428957 [Coniella lustricola]
MRKRTCPSVFGLCSITHSLIHSLTQLAYHLEVAALGPFVVTDPLSPRSPQYPYSRGPFPCPRISCPHTPIARPFPELEGPFEKKGKNKNQVIFHGPSETAPVAPIPVPRSSSRLHLQLQRPY